MTKEQRAFIYAKLIKAGRMSVNDAILGFRQSYTANFMEALELLQIAVGNINEFGSAYDPLTDPASSATL